MGYLLFLLLFSLSFLLFCHHVGNIVRNNVTVVTVQCDANGKRVTCGGFVCDGAIMTVAHILEYVDRNECASVHMNGCSYYPSLPGICVHMNGQTFFPLSAYVDEQNDLCLFPLPEVRGNVTFRENPTFFTSYYLPSIKEKTNEKKRLLFLSPFGRGTMLCLSGIVESGSSGYPVLDYSGDVTGIVCSVDHNKTVTYATGGKALISLYETYEKNYKSSYVLS